MGGSALPMERCYRVGPVELSGLECGPARTPRGVVIALHGSGYLSRYWDYPADPAASLLRQGRALGYRVIAVDRPGYGRSRAGDADTACLESQARILAGLIAQVRRESRPAPVFLVGHSLGSLMAVRLAAREAAANVAGLDVTGLPLRWRTDIRAAVESDADGFGSSLHDTRRRFALFYGPPGTYDPRMVTAETEFTHRIPRIEMRDSLASPQILRALAPKVRVPVQSTVAEHEKVIVGGRQSVTVNRALFSSSPRSVARWQPRAGHNVSLHHVAGEYHARALAFFEEIRSRLRPDDPDSEPSLEAAL
jgi:pimeloyl-ACP methyl ester carboxylesterase